MTVEPRSGRAVSQRSAPAGHEPANLGDILERVLDRGLVIVGDIRISLLDIELLTVKLRLLIASVDTAKQLGIDWWQHDPWLSSNARKELPEKTGRRELRERERERLEPGERDGQRREPGERERRGRRPGERDGRELRKQRDGLWADA